MRSRITERPLQHVSPDKRRERQQQGYPELVAKHSNAVARMGVVAVMLRLAIGHRMTRVHPVASVAAVVGLLVSVRGGLVRCTLCGVHLGPLLLLTLDGAAGRKGNSAGRVVLRNRCARHLPEQHQSCRIPHGYWSRSSVIGIRTVLFSGGPRRESTCAVQRGRATFRPMRRLLAAVTATWMLGAAFAPAVLGTNCDPAAPHGCCQNVGSGVPAASLVGYSLSCACDELRTAPPAPATVPERLTTPAPIAVLVGIVAILPNLDSDSRPELPRAPRDRPVV